MNNSDHQPGGEEKHYMQCPTCKQWFDMRELNQVFAHEHQLPKLPHFYVEGSEKLSDVPFYKRLMPVNLN